MFNPKTRLQRILFGENIIPKNHTEEAVKHAVNNSGVKVVDGNMDDEFTEISIPEDALDDILKSASENRPVFLHIPMPLINADTYAPLSLAVNADSSHRQAVFTTGTLMPDGQGYALFFAAFNNSNVGTVTISPIEE